MSLKLTLEKTANKILDYLKGFTPRQDIYCETPIPKAQRSGMGKLNNPAQQRV